MSKRDHVVSVITVSESARTAVFFDWSRVHRDSGKPPRDIFKKVFKEVYNHVLNAKILEQFFNSTEYADLWYSKQIRQMTTEDKDMDAKYKIVISTTE